MAPTRVIRCGTPFDATGAAPIRDAVVVVCGGRIDAAGPAATTPVLPNAEALGVRGRWTGTNRRVGA
jgi:hypothetical protein